MGKFALFIVLAMTFGMLVYSYGLQRNLLVADEQMLNDYNISQSRNIAQSTAMIIINSLRDSSDDTFLPEDDATPYYYPSDTTQFESWGDLLGDYKLRVTSKGDSLLIRVTGRYAGFEYPMEIALIGNPVWDPLFPYAVFTESGMNLGGSASIHGHAGTNATNPDAVTMSWATRIDSSLSIGPGGDIATVTDLANPAGNVGQDILNLPSPQSYPLPMFPAFPAITTTSPDLDISAYPVTPPLSMSDFEGVYIPELRITGNATLTMLTGNQDRELHIGRLLIQQGHFIIEGDGEVTLYIEEEIELSGSSTSFNRPEGSDGNAMTYYQGDEDIDFGGSTTFTGNIYVSSADIMLNGSNGIQGNIISGGDNITITGNAQAISRTIYAPNAYIEMTGSSVVYGAIVADDFDITGNSQVFYDPELDTPLPELPEPAAEPWPVLYWR